MTDELRAALAEADARIVQAHDAIAAAQSALLPVGYIEALLVARDELKQAAEGLRRALEYIENTRGEATNE